MAETLKSETFEALYKPKKIAKKFGITQNALAIMRHKGTGPKYIELSRRAIRYRKSDILAYIKTKESRWLTL